MTKKTNRTKENTKEYKKRLDILRQIKEGREKHDASRKRKIPGFGVGVRAEHKYHGIGTIVSESMDYFHRVDLMLDKPVVIAGHKCKTINVWPGDMVIIPAKKEVRKSGKSRKRIKKNDNTKA